MKIVLIAMSYFFSLTTMAQLKPVNSGVYKWADHPVTMNADRESRKILEGTSTHLDYLEIHATTQFPGAKPSTAHANDDIEECIIVKEGMMKATVEGRSANFACRWSNFINARANAFGAKCRRRQPHVLCHAVSDRKRKWI